MTAQLSLARSPPRLPLFSRVCAGAELGDFFFFEPVVMKWWHHLRVLLVLGMRFPPPPPPRPSVLTGGDLRPA